MTTMIPPYTPVPQEGVVGIEPPEWQEPPIAQPVGQPFVPMPITPPWPGDPKPPQYPPPPGYTPEDWPRYEFPSAGISAIPTSGYTGGLPPIPSIPQQAPFDWLAEAKRIAQVQQVQDTIRMLQEGLGPIRSSLQEMLNLSPEALESRYQAEIQTPSLRYFGEQTLPSLRRSFVGPGTYWSSMRAGAEQRAGERLNEALMAQRSRMVGEAQNKALSASGLAMQLEQQAFGGGMYPWETALKAAPTQVQARGQDLQRELAEAQNILSGRGQDLSKLLTEGNWALTGRGQDLNYWATLEQMRQRERELWGYLNPSDYTPSAPTAPPTPPDAPYEPEPTPPQPYYPPWRGGGL